MQYFTAMDLPLLPSFLLTALLVELTPGPNMVWLALLSATEGRRAALSATIGIALGLAIISAAAALGVAELAVASPGVFAILRYGGAAFLVWLAWEAWVGAAGLSSTPTDKDSQAKRHFQRGLTINLLNPKAGLFFIAILPGFVVSGSPVGQQTLMLSASYVAVATIVHLVIIAFAGTANKWIGSGNRATIAGRIAAALLVGVAVWLLFETRR